MIHYNYTASSNLGGGGSVGSNNYEFGGNTNNSNNNSNGSGQQSLFSQIDPASTPVSANSTTSTSRNVSGLNQFQSPLNNLSMLKPTNTTTTSTNSTSNYSTPYMGNIDLASSSLGALTSNNYNAASYSRQRFLNSKGFDLEDDLEFCPEIPHSNHYYHHHLAAAKFNPYTSSTFSPISPPLTLAEPLVSSPTATTASASALNGVKKTPVQDRSQTLSPRIHTPRIKKPLEIINPLTGSKVGSPGFRN